MGGLRWMRCATFRNRGVNYFGRSESDGVIVSEGYNALARNFAARLGSSGICGRSNNRDVIHKAVVRVRFMGSWLRCGWVYGRCWRERGRQR